MFENDYSQETVYSVIYHFPILEKLEEKMPKLLEFAKKIPVEYEDDDFEVIYERYAEMYYSGKITMEELNFYIAEEKKKREELSKAKGVKVVPNFDGGYVFYLKKPVYLDLVVDTVAKLYFGINDDMWQYVKPLFYTILDQDLNLNEDNIQVYIELLSDIKADPIYALDRVIVDKLRRLDEFKDVEDIKNAIGVSTKDLSKCLIEYLLTTIKSVKENPESKAVLEAILSLY